MAMTAAPPDSTAPPVDETSRSLTPPRDLRAVAVIVAAGSVLAASVLPWERWCSPTPPHPCFDARAWQGSAASVGLAATALAAAAIVLVIASTVRSGRHTAALAALAAAATTSTVKLFTDAAHESDYHAHQSEGSLLGPGQWIGASVVVAAWIVVAVVAWRSANRRRTIVAAAVVVLIAAAASIPYATSALAWWGGPLSDPAFLGGGNAMGGRAAPGTAFLFQGLIYVRDGASSPVTFDGLDVVGGSVTALGASSGPPREAVRVLGTYVLASEPCPPAGVDLGFHQLLEGRCAYPLEGYRLEPGPDHEVMLAVMFELRDPSVFRSDWFRVRYHVGPLHYEMFRSDEVVICAPLPGHNRCPGDGLR